MKKAEAEQLRQEILTKNIYLSQLRIWFILSTFVVIACALVAVWGFSGVHDVFLPQISAQVRQPIAWISAIVGVLATFFLAMVTIALINGRKHVLTLIDQLNGKVAGKLK